MGLQLKLTTNNFNTRDYRFLKNYPALRIGGLVSFIQEEREGENATTKDAVPKGRRC